MGTLNGGGGDLASVGLFFNGAIPVKGNYLGRFMGKKFCCRLSDAVGDMKSAESSVNDMEYWKKNDVNCIDYRLLDH